MDHDGSARTSQATAPSGRTRPRNTYLTMAPRLEPNFSPPGEG